MVHRGLTGDASNYISDGINSNTVMSTPPTSGTDVFVRANEYDPRRARIVIYNFDKTPTVSVDVSSVLQVGEAYRVHSTFGLFEEALLEGVYGGGSLEIPMGTVAPPQSTGLDGIEYDDDPHEQFGVFILTHGGVL